MNLIGKILDALFMFDLPANKLIEWGDAEVERNPDFAGQWAEMRPKFVEVLNDPNTAETIQNGINALRAAFVTGKSQIGSTHSHHG